MSSLTKYEEGSVKELWTLSLPLMLSSLSILLLIFVDRILLARYSTEALNASVVASTLGWACVVGWMALSSITEVFVSRYNGGGKKEKLGEPVWQMIWFSLLSCVFFIPLSIWGAEMIYGSQFPMERDYFGWMMLFCPSAILYSALTGFFVGQGKTTLITVLALITNCVNAFLDLVLIFGWEEVIPSLGVKGAAIATSSSSVLQTIVLSVIFLSKRNRQHYGTSHYGFRMKPFLDCLKIGLPGAIFSTTEILGWAVYYELMTLASLKHITIAGVCQSIIILFSFFGEGVSKAAIAITGNYIGAGRLYLIHKVLFAGIRLHLLFFFFLLLVFFLAKGFLIAQFLPYDAIEDISSLHSSLEISLLCVFCYLLFEGVRWLLSGILTAAGDTLFLLWFGSLSMWVFLVTPIYLIVLKGGASIEVSVLICLTYSVVTAFLYYWRFSDGRWKSVSISS